MKFYISLAVNVLLLVTVIVLMASSYSTAIGNFYLRRKMGGLVGTALHELRNGNKELVQYAFEAISPDANDDGLNEAYDRLRRRN